MSTPDTLSLWPFYTAGRFPYPHVLGICRGSTIEYTGGPDVLSHVRELGLGFGALGVERGTRVAILSESQPKWLFADLAVLATGGVTVPLYPTVSAAQVGAILADSGAAVVVVSSPEQLAKVDASLPQCPSITAIVTLFEAPPARDGGPRVVSWSTLTALGHQRIVDGWGVAREFHERAKAVGPDDLATIIYTSGSAGDPKGVMLTHANIVSNVRGAQAVLALSESDVGLSFLPLCHAFERTVAYVYLASGVSLVFAESIDTLPRDLLTVRPTVMSGVPRVYEKMLDRVMERGRAETGIRRRVFDLALAVARARGAREPDGGTAPLWARVAAPLCERLVFGPVRAGLGGRIRFTVSGSAPLREDVGRLFFGMGLPILEGYGLTETAPVCTVNLPGRIRFGTVGPPLPDVTLRIASDGEILVKGPNVMAGYFNQPAMTAQAIVDGWFHTGDIGAIDADGSLRITDRKKEIIVTAGGKNVAPQPIEAALRRQRLIAEAVVIGDRQRFPAVLLLPRWKALAEAVGAAEPADADARRGLAARADVLALLQQSLDDVNAPLAQFEKLKAFAVIVDDFGVVTGELTPTLKVKRRVIEERYRDQIAAVYSSSATIAR